MDHQLETNARFTTAIDAIVRNSSVLLVVLSPGFLASGYCLEELKSFIEKEAKPRGEPPDGIFLVEFEGVEHERRPPGLENLNARKFWVQDEKTRQPRTLGIPTPAVTDQMYYEVLERLVCDLAAELRRRAGLPGGGERQEAPPGRAMVFLAEATDDLDESREQVRRYLIQAGFDVLPPSFYPNDEAGFRAAAEADLTKSKLFVQLLGELPGKALDGSPLRRVAVLAQLAKDRRLDRLMWRSRKLSVEQVASGNPDHGKLLGGPDVLALDLEEFKSLVVKRLEVLLRPPSPPSPSPIPPTAAGGPGLGKLVFVNAEPVDSPLVQRVVNSLLQMGASVDLPPKDSRPEDFRKSLDGKLEVCDGMLLIYGQSPATWVSGQLRRSHRALAQRGKPPTIAVYEVPPPDLKPPVDDLIIPGVKFIKTAPRGPALAELQAFLQAL
jgi:hypothetical protein